MQEKQVTVRHRYMWFKIQVGPIRRATIKTTDNNKCWQGSKETGSFTYCWWECKMVHILWKSSLAVPQKIKHRVIIWSNTSTPRHNPREIKIYIHTKLYTQVLIVPYYSHSQEPKHVNNTNVHLLMNK